MDQSQVYIEVIFNGIDETRKDILIALLDEAGYDGFVEDSESLKAYISSDLFEQAKPEEILGDMFKPYQTNRVPQENWNKLWEASFQPVLISGKVLIRADFHEPEKNILHEIVITPKMSFGTGHHATTSLMVEAMLNLDFKNKSVLDFGTGTGILAILAEKLGAEHVFAIDHDPWSIENAMENVEKNFCKKIVVQRKDNISGFGRHNFVLANINKNVILDAREHLAKSMEKEGILLLSGLIATDLDDIMAAFKPFLGSPKEVKEKNNWLCLAFKNERIGD